MSALRGIRRSSGTVFFGLLVALSLAVCDDPTEPDPADDPVEDPSDPVIPGQPVAFEIEPDDVRLDALAQQHRLEVSATDSAGDPADPPAIEWVSADTAVATVGAPGWITAVANGETWVTGTALGTTDSVRVTVDQQVAALDLTPSSAGLEGIGASSVPLSGRAVDANGFPVEGTAVESYRILNPEVATIDESRVVTARRDGQTSVAVDFGDAGVAYAVVTVTVRSSGLVTDWGEEYSAESSLNAVWGASPDDVFAVGDGGLILHFDGAAWRVMSSGHDGDLGHVWGFSGTDVYASGPEAVLHYDGERWSTVLEGGPFGGVWGPGRDDVHVVGDTHRFDGDTWQPVSLVLTDLLQFPWLQVVWGASADEVWSFGRADQITDYSVQEAAIIGSLQDGRWLVEPLREKDPTPTFADLVGFGERHLALLNDEGYCHCVLELQGDELTSLYEGAPRESNRALWGPHPRDLYLGGNNQFLDGYPAKSPGLHILHYDGSEWTRVHVQRGDDRVNGIWGTAVDDLIAVTEHGRVLRGRRH